MALFDSHILKTNINLFAGDFCENPSCFETETTLYFSAQKLLIAFLRFPGTGRTPLQRDMISISSSKNQDQPDLSGPTPKSQLTKMAKPEDSEKKVTIFVQIFFSLIFFGVRFCCFDEYSFIISAKKSYPDVEK